MQQLFNLLAILTNAIKIMLREKVRNHRFWQVVESRELIIIEMANRRKEII